MSNPVPRHVPEHRSAGWTMVLQTPKGSVRLWYGWMENKLVLAYPGPKQMLMDSLLKKGHGRRLVDVALRFLAKHRKEIPVYGERGLTVMEAFHFLQQLPREILEEVLRSDPGIGPIAWPDGVFSSEDLFEQVLGVTTSVPVANARFGTRRWAAYYGPHLDAGGRVWVAHDAHTPHDLQSWEEVNGIFQCVPYGHDRGLYIFTEEFSFFNDAEPEAPNATPEVIRPYRDRFIAMAVEIAQKLGGVSMIYIDYGYGNFYTPDTIATAYARPAVYRQNPLVYRADAQGETLYLVEDALGGPWKNVRKVYNVRPDLQAQLIELLTF